LCVICIAQSFAFASDGGLYEFENGRRSDDGVKRIRAGGNPRGGLS